MNLHEDKEAFKDLVNLTSESLGIEEIYVEKDYYAVLALKSLSESDVRANGIFKGGTSLSKAYTIINRFSEDIDMAIVNDGGTQVGSRAQMKAVEKALTSSAIFEEDLKHERVKKGGRLRQSVHKYPLLDTKADYGQASKHLFIDASRMSVGIPFEERQIRTYISQFLAQTGQEDVLKEFSLHPIVVPTLSMQRTFVEKFGSVVKFAYLDEQEGDGKLNRLRRGIRHIYDLHMLLQQGPIVGFMRGTERFNEQSFEDFLHQVLLDDLAGNQEKNGYADYMNSAFADCLLYRAIDDTWDALRATYESDFSRLHFQRRELPSSKDIIETLIRLQRACQNFDAWKKENNVIYAIQT